MQLCVEFAWGLGFPSAHPAIPTPHASPPHHPHPVFRVRSSACVCHNARREDPAVMRSAAHAAGARRAAASAFGAVGQRLRRGGPAPSARRASASAFGAAKIHIAHNQRTHGYYRTREARSGKWRPRSCASTLGTASSLPRLLRGLQPPLATARLHCSQRAGECRCRRIFECHGRVVDSQVHGCATNHVSCHVSCHRQR